MIYYLGKYLQDHVEALSFLRLVDSISFRAIFGAITALLLTIFLGGRVILFFYRRGQRDMPRDYINLPASGNQAKTYGGGLIVTVILLSVLLWCKLHITFVLVCLGAVVWFAMRGMSRMQPDFWSGCLRERRSRCLQAAISSSRPIRRLLRIRLWRLGVSSRRAGSAWRVLANCRARLSD